MQPCLVYDGRNMPNDDLTIIDNAVAPIIQQGTLETCLNHIQYTFADTTLNYKDPNLKKVSAINSLETPLWQNIIYREDIGQNHKTFPQFLPMLMSMGVSCEKLIRIVVNMTVQSPKTTEITHGIPHIDHPYDPENLMTALYYVNDSDGDTVFFNEKYPYQGPLTVRQTVTPKKGRLVVFDGRIYHAANNPRTNDYRITVNFNFRPFFLNEGKTEF